MIKRRSTSSFRQLYLFSGVRAIWFSLFQGAFCFVVRTTCRKMLMVSLVLVKLLCFYLKWYLDFYRKLTMTFSILLKLHFECLNNLENLRLYWSFHWVLLMWGSFHHFNPPWGRRGFKSRIRHPYPQHVVKGD